MRVYLGQVDIAGNGVKGGYAQAFVTALKGQFESDNVSAQVVDFSMTRTGGFQVLIDGDDQINIQKSLRKIFSLHHIVGMVEKVDGTPIHLKGEIDTTARGQTAIQAAKRFGHWSFSHSAENSPAPVAEA